MNSFLIDIRGNDFLPRFNLIFPIIIATEPVSQTVSAMNCVMTPKPSRYLKQTYLVASHVCLKYLLWSLKGYVYESRLFWPSSPTR